MEMVEELAYEIYNKNLEYFLLSQKELMKLLVTFDMAVTKGDYIPEYDLEYMDSYFDIKNINSSRYLYNTDSYKFSKKFSKTVNFKKNSNTFEGFPIYTFTDELIDTMDSGSQSIKSMLPLMRYYSEHFTNSDSMKEINKFIFIGVNLGLHIEIISEKTNADEYLIIEDNLEIFKLSMFTTKYYELAQKAKLFFSIADDENMFLKTVQNFLSELFFANRYLKYARFPSHSDTKLKLIQPALMTQSFIFFPYKLSLKKYLRPLSFMNNNSYTINLTNGFHNNKNIDKPVLVLGAGPSFKENINWLKKNHHKFILIASTAVLNYLYLNNIKPDIMTHIDGSEIANKHFVDVDVDIFLKDTIMIFGPHSLVELRNKFSKEKVFNYEEGTFYNKGFSAFPASCVGSFSILLSLIMSINETYLLGMDLAINQKTGETHSSDHSRSKKVDISQKDNISDTMNFELNLFKVQGNFQDSVYTNSLLHASVQTLYRNIPVIKADNQVIYNLNDGAKIQSCVPTHIEDVNLENYHNIDKNKLHNSLLALFKSHSTTELNEDDLNSIKLRAINAKNIKNLIFEFENSSSKSNSDRYQYDLLGLVSTILKKDGREFINLTHVFYDYFQFVIPIITDMFNTKGLKNEKRHIKKIDKMIIAELHALCDTYINTLEKFLLSRVE
ncbi:MAG: DUF115 domain-containing protein [Sulfurimonas sp.]|nr:DUF115 domain-containing protein [Sulfurimonas sp.]